MEADDDADGGSNRKGRKRPLDDVSFDAAIAPHRAVVERVIARVKNWNVLTTRTHMVDQLRVSRLAAICAALSNFLIDFNEVEQV